MTDARWPLWRTSVRLRGQLVGQIGLDRTYTAADKPLDWDFS